MKTYFIFILLSISLICQSCTDDEIKCDNKRIVFTSFALKSPESDNVYMLDVDLENNEICINETFPDDVDLSKLIAIYNLNINSSNIVVKVNGINQISGKTINNYTESLNYEIYKKGNLVSTFECKVYLRDILPDITINLDEKKQIFFGAGGSIGLYAGHWTSLSHSEKEKAAALLAKDINLQYLKTYINDVAQLNSYKYESFVDCYNYLKKYNPNIKTQINVYDLPDKLEKKDGNKVDENGNPITLKSIYDETIPDIFGKIAEYYFTVISDFKKRGIIVDQLDLLNEPGGVDLAVFQGKKFSEVVPILRSMINNPSINTMGLKMPEIVGVSHWGVTGTISWFSKWKEELPDAYEQLDVISTHGYSGGWIESNYKQVREFIGDNIIFQNNEQTGKLQPGDGLYEIFKKNDSEPIYVGDVSIAMRISDAVNGGVNYFFIFQINNPTGNNAALLKTPYRGIVSKSTVYSGFKQLTSYQPADSYCLSRDINNDQPHRVLCFNNGDKFVYLHITNVLDKSEDFTVEIHDKGIKRYIKSIEGIFSDKEKDEEIIEKVSFEEKKERIIIKTTPFSVNSFKLELE